MCSTDDLTAAVSSSLTELRYLMAKLPAACPPLPLAEELYADSALDDLRMALHAIERVAAQCPVYELRHALEVLYGFKPRYEDSAAASGRNPGTTSPVDADDLGI